MIPEIAIGAIVAAIIGSMISLVGLIVAKESKVSEFRQAWIDSLRSELAAFASNLNALSDANVIEFESDKDRFEKLKEQTNKLNESFFSVALRLNINEKQSGEVQSSMVRLARLVRQPDEFSKVNFDSEQIEFIRVCNSLLKHEWNRVKSGEKVYRWTRLAAVSLIAVLIAIMSLMIGNGLISQPRPKPPVGKAVR